MRFRLIASIFFSIVFLLNSATAVKVGVYLEPRDREPEGYCVNVNSGADAYRVLSKIDATEFLAFESQHVLCSIDEDKSFVCDATSSRSIRTVLLNDDETWPVLPIPSYDAGNNCARNDFGYILSFPFYSFATHTYSNAHYCAKDGDVLGVINEARPQGQPNSPPDFAYTPTFEQLCEPLQINDMDMFSGNVRLNDIDDDGGNVREVVLGRPLKLVFEVENIANDFGAEIEDIEVSLYVANDAPSGATIGVEDLSPGDDEEVTLMVDIPTSLSPGKHKLTLVIEGEDNLDNSYKTEVDYTLIFEATSMSDDAKTSSILLSDSFEEISIAEPINLQTITLGTKSEAKRGSWWVSSKAIFGAVVGIIFTLFILVLLLIRR
jgi:hypothetical protein